MRITALRLRNWTCHREREIRFAPLTVIRGPNGSGKTSIRDGIDFALTGAVQRVPLKGQRAMLLSEAADPSDVGTVEVVADGLLYRRAIRTGRALANALDPATTTAIPFLLTPAIFASVSPAVRYDLLLQVLRVGTEAESHKLALKAAGHPAPVVDDLPIAAPDAWEGLVDRWRSEARGAWQEVTGERWSATAAATWRAPRPDDVPSDDDFRLTSDAMHERQNSRQRLRADLASLNADRVRIDLLLGRLAYLAPMVAAHDDMRAECAAAAVDLAILEAENADEALAELITSFCLCPACGSRIPAAPPDTPDDADPSLIAAARARLAAANAAEDEARRADKAAAQLHAATSAAMRENEDIVGRLATMKDPAADIAAIEADIREHELAMMDLGSEARAMTTRFQADRDAGRREKLASFKAERVDAMSALLAAIKSRAVTRDAFAEKLAAFNATLAAHARDLACAAPAIGHDAAITTGGRPYVLLSEAERWRTDAILAVALAEASGVRLVLLDRWDVLDPGARLGPLHWLADLTSTGALDTAILSGTVPAPRCPPPGDIAWLELN